jgi:hypothetical protein
MSKRNSLYNIQVLEENEELLKALKDFGNWDFDTLSIINYTHFPL